MKTLMETHPWITFQLDLSRAPWDLWLLAGEATSKCEHIEGAALRPEAADELMRIYLAKGVAATTAIEGNTLTEQQVRQRIEGTLELPQSKEYLGVEIDNIVAACNDIGQGYLRGDPALLTPELIKRLNSQILKQLPAEPHVVPGEYRECSVGVADYRAVPWQEVPALVARLCEWVGSPWLTERPSMRGSDRIRLDAILKAVLAHLYLAWIHPFGDGNGRTARLVEFHILVNAGIPFPAAHLLSNHYNQTRSEYYRQLSHASKSGGDVIPFCIYALRGFVDQLREQIEVIREQQWKLFWQNHVHQTLGDSKTGQRRRWLVLDLAKSAAPVERRRLVDLSSRVMRGYLGKSEKALDRDLRELERLNLVERSGEGYRANVEVVRAYLPPSRPARP